MWDTLNYLPYDILHKIDSASMAFSVESRAPFLNVDLYLKSLSLEDTKISNGKRGKINLEHILGDLIPIELWKDKKRGFGPPLGDWFRNELKLWADHYLNNPKLYDLIPYKREYIMNIWERHLSSKSNYQHEIWAIIALSYWLSHKN